MNTNDSYILQCRENYFKNIFPSDEQSRLTPEYKKLVKIAEDYFGKDQYDLFAEFFMEGHYLIQLWTAHLIIEYGKPSDALRRECMEMISKYSDNALSPEVAKQEKKWLLSYNR